MGLLEDAIREHLELKRLRGADPAEVAREQREVLDHPSGVEPTGGAQPEPEVAEPAADDDGAPTRAEPALESGPSAGPSDFSSVGQETAELDMEAVLDGEDRASADQDDPEGRPAGSEGSARAAPVDEDSLEWEVPAVASRDPEPGSGDRPEDEGEPAERASDHEPSTEELRSGRTDDQQAPGQGRLSF